MLAQTLNNPTPATTARWHKARRLRNYLLLSVLVGSVWGYALLWVIAHYRFAGNETDSLPDAFFIVALGQHVPQRGELLPFRIGASVRHYPTGMIFIKQVVGMPGDALVWQGDTAYVGGQRVGVARSHTPSGDVLVRTPAVVIPPEHYFVATEHPDSYDSRYQDVGLVSAAQIAGRVLW